MGRRLTQKVTVGTKAVSATESKWCAPQKIEPKNSGHKLLF